MNGFIASIHIDGKDNVSKLHNYINNNSVKLPDNWNCKIIISGTFCAEILDHCCYHYYGPKDNEEEAVNCVRNFLDTFDGEIDCTMGDFESTIFFKENN